MIKIGQKAPTFTLLSSKGGKFNLSDSKGKWVVLYFYPKDLTPGCTVEACNFRDLNSEFVKHNALIYGISVDDLKSHEKFIEKHHLPFPLLSDIEKKVVEKYGVWQQKSMMGRKFWGIVRTTFLIDPNGKIAYIWPKVNVSSHHQEVLEKIVSLK